MAVLCSLELLKERTFPALVCKDIPGLTPSYKGLHLGVQVPTNLMHFGLQDGCHYYYGNKSKQSEENIGSPWQKHPSSPPP
jgi:hypothetical protein